MNVLYITNQDPNEYGTGGQQRANLITRAIIACIGHTDVLCLRTVPVENNSIANCSIISIDNDSTNSNISHSVFLERLIKIKRFLYIFSNQVIEKKDPSLAKKINDIIGKNNYDYIICSIIDAVKFDLTFNKKIILDLDDLPEQLYKTKNKITVKKNIIKYILKSLFNKIIYNAIHYHTQKISKKCKYVFLSNKKQCLLFRNSLHLPGIPYFKNTNSLTILPENKFNVLFVGTLVYSANFYGVEHFIEKIWPNIIREIPNAHFNIVGHNDGPYLTNEKIKYWESFSGVKILGFAEDIAFEYSKNNVVVAPIYQGAGMNVKVIEAMHMGKACVISSFASRSFESFLDNENILISKNDDEFACNVIKLLTDTELSIKMGQNAKKAISKDYSIEKFFETVQSAIID
ncbi:hypothetical protein FACS189483_06380 [Spirochaetia bacterium]|nr:hypothetical protein FACS189483_06380 [Spirochaetia bacterium]